MKSLAGLVSGTYKDFKVDFGAGGIGGDDSAAFNAFRAWALAQNPNPVYLFIPPGLYTGSNVGPGNDSWAWLDGIMDVTIEAYGATVETLAASGDLLNHQNFVLGQGCARIAQTSPGDPGVTCLAPAQASTFSVGQSVIVCSNEQQGGPTQGYPPSWHKAEYHVVAAINSASGLVTLEGNIRHRHLATLPATGTGSQDYGGPATIFAMNASWAQEVKWLGGTLGNAAAHPQAQFNCAFRKFLFRDVTFNFAKGVSPSQSQQGLFDNCNFYGSPSAEEVDKNNENITHRRCTFWGPIYNFSASTDRLVYEGCEGPELNYCAGSNLSVSNSNFGTINVNPTYGGSETLSIENTTAGFFNVNTSFNSFNPTDVLSWMDGVLVVPVADFPASWAIPGQRMAFIDDTSVYFGANSAAFGMFEITDVTSDGTNYRVATTLTGKPSSIPGYGGTVNLVRGVVHPLPSITVRNSGGHPTLKSLSRAPEGKPFGSYFHRRISKPSDWADVTENYFADVWGIVTMIKVDVIRAYTGGRPAPNMFVLYMQQAALAQPDNVYQATAPAFIFDLTVAGERLVTPAESLGFAPNDALSVDPSPGQNWYLHGTPGPFALSLLPPNLLVGRMLVSTGPSGQSYAADTPAQLPIVEVEIWTSQ
jgi:hypothetical protein